MELLRRCLPFLSQTSSLDNSVFVKPSPKAQVSVPSNTKGAIITSKKSGKKKMPSELNVVVCGGGNGAHCFAGLCGSNIGAKVLGSTVKTISVLTLYKDEYTKWNKEIEVINDRGAPIIGKVNEITNKAEKIIPQAQFIVFVVPAFAHKQYLTELKPHLKPGCILGAMPGGPAFDMVCLSVLGQELMDSITLFSMETLPWACRLLEYGRQPEILGTKISVDIAIKNGTDDPEGVKKVPALLAAMIGDAPQCNTPSTFLGCTLMSINAILHPTMMYAYFKDWDGSEFDEKPLFYESAGPVTGDLLTKVSQEVANICTKINSKYPNIDLSVVKPIRQWYISTYNEDIADTSSMHRILNTNKGYKGLTFTMVSLDNGKYLPDFGYRYLSEDVPYGLTVMRGVGELFDVPTPTIDLVITWAQEKLGKEFLVGGKMAGKDIGETRAPQRFGFTQEEQFIKQNHYSD